MHKTVATIRNFLKKKRPTANNDVAVFLQALYPELKRLAVFHMSRERIGHTLCPTALVSEAYLKLSQSRHLKWIDKAHFLALSSRCIRQILVDYARERNAQKRGGGQTLMTLKEELAGGNNNSQFDVLLLDEVLKKLEKRDPIQVQVVELRFFSGMTNMEVANVLGISLATVKRKWIMAKAWLYREMNR